MHVQKALMHLRTLIDIIRQLCVDLCAPIKKLKLNSNDSSCFANILSKGENSAVITGTGNNTSEHPRLVPMGKARHLVKEAVFSHNVHR